ncbi:caspase family protein [Marinifilum flexuosum]|uniref:caspase family protein n=1 Tax=Marinifilum flexuosum TaxID=1117708 RepID=UPI0024951A74|nr:caspase family protein [Marinifilum flexuosum]
MKIKTLFWIFLIAQLLLADFNVAAQSTVPKLRLNPEMHMEGIMKISTDAQGKYLLSVSFDKTAKLWDAQTGKLIRTFRTPIGSGFEGSLWGGAISPDGNIIAVGGSTGFNWDQAASIYIFNRSTGQLIQRLSGLHSLVLDIEFSPNGKFMAASLGAESVEIYKSSINNGITKWSKLKSLNGYGSKLINNVAFSSQGKFASVCNDGKIRLYDKYFNLTNVISGAGNEPYSVCFSPDGQKIAIGYTDTPEVEVFSGSDLSLLYRPKLDGMNDNDGFILLSFSPDGKYLYGSGNYQKVIHRNWWWMIRKWSDAGQGDYTDYPVSCHNSIMDIKITGSEIDQSLLLGGGQPYVANLDAHGNRNFYKVGELYDFSNHQFDYFKINNNGDEIAFTPTNGEAIYFSVKERRLLEYEDQTALKLYTANKSGISITDWNDNKHPKINGTSANFLGKRDECLTTDIANGGEKIVFGGNFQIYCTDKLGHKIWETPAQMKSAYAINISENDQVVAATQDGGVINWYSMDDGEHLLTLYVHPQTQKWILFTPSGLFDCSPGAESLAGWHINQGADQEAKFYPLSQFYEKYYTPNLGARILGGEDIQVEDILADLKLPPLVEILTPRDNEISSKKEVEVTIKVTDQGGGIDNIQLYLNDKLVETSQRGFKTIKKNGESKTKTFHISLVNGKNKIRATAFNEQRTESIPHEITVFYEGSSYKSDLHLLAIGVNQYKNPRYKLNYAEADASGFLNEIKKGSGDVFENVNITYLKNEEVTRTRILQEFEKLKQTAKPEDVFVFYYAGHGVMSEEKQSQFYIVPYDLTQIYGNNELLQSKAVSANELQTFATRLRAQKQMFVIDACQSGGITELLASRGAAEEKAIAQLARSTGTYWLAASNSEQFATEVSTLGHGIFTYAILQGLKGQADSGSKDRKITVQELDGFLNDKVPELSKKYKGESQYPNSYGYGQDFPLVIIK